MCEFIGNMHICCFEGPEPSTKDLDLRRSKDQDEFVIRSILLDPRRSIFEITDKDWTARAYTRLQDAGVIKRVDDCETGYPWCEFEIGK